MINDEEDRPRDIYEAEDQIERLNARVVELLRERDALRKALTDILDANNEPYLIARKALGAKP